MDLGLTNREQRLADYIANDGSLVIGDVCNALHTTPRTLLGKTLPGLRAKLEAYRAAHGQEAPPTPQESQTGKRVVGGLRKKHRTRNPK